MPNNLTDAEVKKALDICSKSNNGCSYSKYPCKDCYLNGQPMCSSVLIQDTIDLINRQDKKNENLKAEIEKLNKIILKGDFSSITALRAREHWFRQNTEHINRLNAEVERLKKGWKADVILAANVKAEAYKKFANLLDKKISIIKNQLPNDKLVEQTIQVCQNIIKIVVNELVGDK